MPWIEKDAPFTVAEFLDAIEKNGLPQEKHMFWSNEDGEPTKERDKVTRACALGMGAYNLGLSITNFNFPNIGKIIDWNDGLGLSFQEIANKYRATYPDLLDKKVTLTVQEELEDRAQ